MLQMAHSYTNPFRSITKLGFVMVLLMLSPLGAKDNGVNASPISIDLVTVGDLGNIADTSTHHGSVGECFRIGKYDLKASEYCAFLNAVAQTNDTFQLYDSRMSSDEASACIKRDKSEGKYLYAPKKVARDIKIGISMFNSMLRYLLIRNFYSPLRYENQGCPMCPQRCPMSWSLRPK